MENYAINFKHLKKCNQILNIFITEQSNPFNYCSKNFAGLAHQKFDGCLIIFLEKCGVNKVPYKKMLKKRKLKKEKRKKGKKFKETKSQEQQLRIQSSGIFSGKKN